MESEVNKAEIDRKIKELKEDKQELKDAFEKFSAKYGENICGFHIEKLTESCWYLNEIPMRAKFFS